jgi:ABC-type Fe3+-hydroxamate transport system substrate-binding protein
MPDISSVADQMGRILQVPMAPKRIISLVPSQTELLFDLGLADEIVGITKFCIHPADEVKSKHKIGGTKQFNFELIYQLKPDLIIGNKEENYREGIEKLALNYPVWMSDIKDLQSALDMICSIGELTGKAQESNKIALDIATQFKQLPDFKPVKAAYFIWKDPWMAAGANTFINEMLHCAGFINVFENNNGRYPEISFEMLQEAAPEVILLSSEPYPFKEKHLKDLSAIMPRSKITLVDGELFSWYGSRLLQTPDYLTHIRKGLTPGILDSN